MGYKFIYRETKPKIKSIYSLFSTKKNRELYGLISSKQIKTNHERKSKIFFSPKFLEKSFIETSSSLIPVKIWLNPFSDKQVKSQSEKILNLQTYLFISFPN